MVLRSILFRFVPFSFLRIEGFGPEIRSRCDASIETHPMDSKYHPFVSWILRFLFLYDAFHASCSSFFFPSFQAFEDPAFFFTFVSAQQHLQISQRFPSRLGLSLLLVSRVCTIDPSDEKDECSQSNQRDGHDESYLSCRFPGIFDDTI